MDAPTHYADVSESSIEVQAKYKLSDVQTLLYDHISRGDFVLRNEDGQSFYDHNNNGFGWHGDRNWVKKQFAPLIKAGLIKFESVHDCRDGKYTSWYFWHKDFKRETLLDASNYVQVHKLALIKHYLNLPDGFSKNGTYGDLKLVHNKKGFTFYYKGEGNIWSWDYNGKGEKQDLAWIVRGDKHLYQVKNGITCYRTTFYKRTFGELIHDIWSTLAHEGREYTYRVPNYSTRRVFSLEGLNIKKEGS